MYGALEGKSKVKDKRCRRHVDIMDGMYTTDLMLVYTFSAAIAHMLLTELCDHFCIAQNYEVQHTALIPHTAYHTIRYDTIPQVQTCIDMGEDRVAAFRTGETRDQTAVQVQANADCQLRRKERKGEKREESKRRWIRGLASRTL